MAVEVHLVTPEREVWAGEVQELVARGVEGDVGILAGHAPLLVQLAVGQLQLQLPDGSWQKAVVDGGFLHVSSEGGETRADVLASHAELVHEIDVAAARRRLEEYQNRVQENHNGFAKGEIAKAMVRIELAG